MNQERINSEKKHFDMAVADTAQVDIYDTKCVARMMKELTDEAFTLLGDLQDKRMLFYGSGVNLQPVLHFVGNGARVWMIDISPKSIEIVNDKVRELGLSDDVCASVMDCENLEYECNFFDVVYGRAILHHLDLQKAIGEIKRVLKVGGRGVFIEPLGTNPAINLYRHLTPNDRTPDEKPLTRSDFAKLNAMGFAKSCHREMNILVNLGTLYEKVTKREFMFYETTKKIDKYIIDNLRFMKWMCWNTIIYLEK